MIKGLAVWMLALLLAVLMPGAPRAHPLDPFPWRVALLILGFALIMAGAALALVGWLGPAFVQRRSLVLLEAIPDLLWGALVLALWPGAWGPPGLLALALAFWMAALPGELRWLAQALPNEHPFPAAWGPRATRVCRRIALRNLLPRWLGARLPLWVTATLVLERLLGVQGPGSDWMMRVAFRDRLGMSLWLLGFGFLWALFQWKDT